MVHDRERYIASLSLASYIQVYQVAVDSLARKKKDPSSFQTHRHEVLAEQYGTAAYHRWSFYDLSKWKFLCYRCMSDILFPLETHVCRSQSLYRRAIEV